MKKIISFLETCKKDNPISDLLVDNHNVDKIIIFKEQTYKKPDSSKIEVIDLHQNVYKLKECIDAEIIINCDKYKSRFFDLYDRFGQIKLIYKPYYNFESMFSKFLTYGISIIGNDPNEVVVIFNDIPHSPIEYLIYFLSKELDVKLIYFQTLPKLDDHSAWIQFKTTGFEGEESSSTLEGISTLNKSTDKELMKNLSPRFISYLKNYSISNELQLEDNYMKSPTNMTQINTARSMKNNFFYYVNKLVYLISKGRFIRLAYKFITGFVINPIEKIYLKRTMSKYISMLDNRLLIEKNHILYFPLHLQPEATSSPASNFFRNQLLIIKAFSDILGDDQLLVVKDHPATFITSSFDQPERRIRFRNRKFYSSIANMNNVMLVDSSVSSKYLLSLCDTVVTLRGSICLEALINKKPCLIFENSFYMGFPNTVYVNDISDLKNIISKIRNFYISDNDILSTLSYFDSISFDYDETKKTNYKSIVGFIEKEI